MAIQREQLNRIFQRELGRDARPDEFDFFSRFVREGDLQQYEIGETLGATPEAAKQDLRAQTEMFRSELGRSDKGILGEAGDVLAGRFAAQGRSGRGSAFTAAFANAAADLARIRQGQVAQFLGRGIPQAFGQRQQFGQAVRERGYGLRDERRQRNQRLADWRMQLEAQQDMLKTQSRRNLQSGITQSLVRAGLGIGRAGLSAGAGGGGGFFGRFGKALGG